MDLWLKPGYTQLNGRSRQGLASVPGINARVNDQMNDRKDCCITTSPWFYPSALQRLTIGLILGNRIIDYLLIISMISIVLRPLLKCCSIVSKLATFTAIKHAQLSCPLVLVFPETIC
jgi:hypothetical protein